MRVKSVIDLADDAPIGVCFVSVYGDRSMQPHAFDCFAEKGLGRLCISARGESKVDHLAICIDCTRQMGPLPADPDVRLVNMPIEARMAQECLGSFCQFRRELLSPAVDSGTVDYYTGLL